MNKVEIKLAEKNGVIGYLFECEVERRIRAEYTKKRETDILRHTLTDSQEATRYAERVKAIKDAVKAEIDAALGGDIDVGYRSGTVTEGVSYVIDSLLGGGRSQYAEQFRRAVQMFADSLAEDAAMEIATVYDEWEVGKTYAEGKYLRHGLNGVGDPQLYCVKQTHTSQADWAPDVTPALYMAIGLDDDGYPVWSQPTGAHDAYNTGDVVNFEGVLKRSKIDGNVWSPEVCPDYWEDVEV